MSSTRHDTPMKSPLWTFVPILSLFLAPLAGAEVKPLMIYGVSIGEERVAAPHRRVQAAEGSQPLTM